MPRWNIDDIAVSRGMTVSASLKKGWTFSEIVFFYQAEDGIRYVAVTGVQTCALPIFLGFLGYFMQQQYELMDLNKLKILWLLSCQ